jgi:hypothetical protein
MGSAVGETTGCGGPSGESEIVLFAVEGGMLAVGIVTFSRTHMNREIICQSCGSKLKPLHPEDVKNGFKRRVVDIVAKRPEDHKITELAGPDLDNMAVVTITMLPTLQCDRCGTPIPDGQPCKALTMWRASKEPEPCEWESEFNAPILWKTT